MSQEVWNCNICGKESKPRLPHRFRSTKDKYLCKECYLTNRPKTPRPPKPLKFCIKCGINTICERSKTQLCRKCSTEINWQNPYFVEKMKNIHKTPTAVANHINANRKTAQDPIWRANTNIAAQKRRKEYSLLGINEQLLSQNTQQNIKRLLKRKTISHPIEKKQGIKIKPQKEIRCCVEVGCGKASTPKYPNQFTQPKENYRCIKHAVRKAQTPLLRLKQQNAAYIRNQNPTYREKQRLCGIKHSQDMGWREKQKKTRNTIKYKESVMGENNPNWRGGITPLRKQIRECSKMYEWKKTIFERDEYKDWFSGCRGDIVAHHKIPFAKIIKMYNIKTLDDALKCDTLWDINNGVTMLKTTHNAFHDMWGYYYE